VDHTYRYLGGGPSDVVLTDIREAVSFAFREVYNAHTWTYYYKHGRLATVVPQSDGAIDYDATTGIVTLTDATFPDWSADAYLRVGTGVNRVLSMTDPTHLVLDPMIRPNASFSATPYILYKDSYLLPEDFLAGDQAMYENAFGGLQYSHPREWLFSNRYIYQAGMPQAFTVMGEDRYPNRLLLRLFPIPQESKTLDFIYKRSPRPINYASVTTGTASVSVEPNVITFSLPVLTPAMVGSIVRISSNSKVPTAGTGLNPAAFESRISSVDSATSATVEDASPIPYSASSYIISDPLDIEPQSMATLVFRACEMMIGMSRTMKDKPDSRAQYREALATAKEKDSRYFGRRAVGDNWVHRQRAKDMPLDLYPTYK
jgi:hypothetical protein